MTSLRSASPAERLRLARERPERKQQEHRAADRDQPGPEVEELVDVADVERAGDESPEQGTEDPDRRRADAAARFGATGDDGARDRAGEQPQEDPRDDSHAPGTLPCRPGNLPALALSRTRVVAQVPEHVAGGAHARVHR